MFGRFSKKTVPVPVITREKKAISLEDFCLKTLEPNSKKIIKRDKSSCEKDKKDEAWPCKWYENKDKDKDKDKDKCAKRYMWVENCSRR